MKLRSTLIQKIIPVLLLACCISAQAQHNRNRGYYYENWRYYPSRGQVFFSMPGPYLSLQFGGNPYYYSGGFFYRPYGSYYSVVPPPIGIHINILPNGYWPLSIGGNPYYYYNGTFYRHQQSDYEVIQAPVGAEVPAIPRDATVAVIDGEKYYEYNGTYFKEKIKPNGEIWYSVEGKHGILNTDRNSVSNHNSSLVPLEKGSLDAKHAIGDTLEQLPSDSRTIVINSKKYFVSPDNVYYEEVIEGNSIKYRVAGK